MDETTSVLIGMGICILLVILIATPMIVEERKAEKSKEQKREKLLKLQNLKRMGAITEKEYELEKYKIKYGG